MKFTYKYDKDTHTSVGNLKVKNNTYTATARCHPDDSHWATEMTGAHIVEQRCYIKYLKDLLKELKIQKKTLEDLYKSFKCCRRFNKEDYHIHRLELEIEIYDERIEIISNAIELTEHGLKNYIDTKEKMNSVMREKMDK